MLNQELFSFSLFRILNKKKLIMLKMKKRLLMLVGSVAENKKQAKSIFVPLRKISKFLIYKKNYQKIFGWIILGPYKTKFRLLVRAHEFTQFHQKFNS